VTAVTGFAEEAGIGSGFITGIGALCDVELGCFEVETREYIRKVFAGDYELINLTGNISKVDGEPFLHAHVTLGDDKFGVFAGHLFKGTIAVTGEFLVSASSLEISRKHDEETGLKLLDL